MNIDERETAEGFGLGRKTINLHPCDVFFCDRYADDYDPIIIDGRYYCDICGSNKMALHMEKLGTWIED